MLFFLSYGILLGITTPSVFGKAGKTTVEAIRFYK